MYRSPEVVEDNLDASKLVWIVAQKEKAIVVVKMFMQQIHDGINYHFDDVAFFHQLSGLQKEKIKAAQG